MGATGGRDLRLAIVGATGTVGARLVELVDERRFPYAELKAFGGPESSAQSVEGIGRDYPVSALRDPNDLAAYDIVFLAVPRSSAAEVLGARRGPVTIDLSGAARELSRAPLVSPGITPRETIPRLAARGVLAIPNPAAHVLATIFKTLELRERFAGATLIVGASAGGKEILTRLIEQSADLLNARLSVEEGEIQLAFNVFMDRRGIEMAGEILAQAGALLGYAPDLVLQVAQAPTLHGTALALCLSGQCESIRERLREAPGVLLIESEEFRGVVDTVGEEAIMVKAIEQPAGVALWCLFDGARLAALSALWVAENLISPGRSTLA